MTFASSSERSPNQAVVVWGVLGFAALLGRAIWALTPLAIEPLRAGMTQLQIGACVVWVAWMWYTEGYRAFQKQLAPRLVARAVWLARNPRPLYVVLAPLFCMGLFHATRRRLITSWGVLLGVVGLVVAVRFLEQPWRGIVDAGVVVGLGWGLGWLLYHLARALAGREPTADPELPQA